MKITFYDEEFKNYGVEIDYSVEDNLLTFKEEVFNTLYETYKNNNITHLLLSDGSDSRFIYLCCRELGIELKTITFLFDKNYSFVKNNVLAFSENNGNKNPLFFYIEADEFFDHVNFLTEQKKAYPRLNGYYVDFMLHKFPGFNFFGGMNCEWKYYDNSYIDFMPMPSLVKKNNSLRLFDFANSKTFLSYLNDPIFKYYYKKNPLTIAYYDEYYIRDKIYSSIFSNLVIRRKDTDWGDKKIILLFQKYFLPKISKEFPKIFNLDTIKFYVDDYFSKKGTNV